MKVLKVSQECFMWLGIRLADSPTNRRWQILYTFLGWFSLLFLVLLVVSSSVVALNYGTNDLIKALAAAFPAVAAFRLFVSLISMVIYRQEVTLVFENLQTFCNQNSKEKSYGFFVKANELSNKISKFSNIYSPLFVLIVFIVVSTVSVLYCYITRGYIQVDSLFVGLEFAFPWDERTFAGWMATSVFVAAASAIYQLVSLMLLSLFIGIFLNFHAFYKHFVILVEEIDKPSIEMGINNAETQKKKEIHAKRMLHKIIQFHVFVKDLFSVVADIYAAIILILIICVVAFCAINIFELELAIRNMQSSVVTFILGSISSLTDASVFCYCGAMTTYSFSKYADHVFEFHWYDLPVPLQKKLIVIMANLQRPLEYRGFGMVTLNLMTFTKIIRTVLSYYLTFKTLKKT